MPGYFFCSLERTATKSSPAICKRLSARVIAEFIDYAELGTSAYSAVARLRLSVLIPHIAREKL